MTMHITLNPDNQVIKVPAGNVTLEFIDQSGCHIDVVLAIQGIKGGTFHFEDEGNSSVKKTYTLDVGKRYTCSVALYGYSYKTLNRNYNTMMKINNKIFLTAEGVLPDNPGFDNCGVLFYLDTTD